MIFFTEDTLLSVCDYLNFNDKLNLTRVCKFFNSILSASWRSVMRSSRFCINLGSDKLDFSGDLGSGLIIKNRKLSVFELCGFKNYRQCNRSNPHAVNFLKIVDALGITVKKLLISGGEFEFNFMMNLLNAMPNLEEIVVDGAIWKYDISGVLEPHLDFENLLRYGYVTYNHLNNYFTHDESSNGWKNLRRLKCNLLSMELLDILMDSRNIEDIEIDQHSLLIQVGKEQSRFSSEFPNECLELINERNLKFNVKKFEDFLKNQRKLKILKLYDFRQLHFFTHQDSLNSQFQLESLVLKNFTCAECFLQLLENQKNSLRSVSITEWSRPFPAKLFWSIIRKIPEIKNLRNLEFDVCFEGDIFKNSAFDPADFNSFTVNCRACSGNFSNISIVKCPVSCET